MYLGKVVEDQRLATSHDLSGHTFSRPDAQTDGDLLAEPGRGSGDQLFFRLVGQQEGDGVGGHTAPDRVEGITQEVIERITGDRTGGGPRKFLPPAGDGFTGDPGGLISVEQDLEFVSTVFGHGIRFGTCYPHERGRELLNV